MENTELLSLNPNTLLETSTSFSNTTLFNTDLGLFTNSNNPVGNTFENPLLLQQLTSVTSVSSKSIDNQNITSNPTTDFDPLTGKTKNSEPANNDSLVNTLAADFPGSSWVFQGKFGDFDGGNDVPLNITDANNQIVETFSLTGDGYAEVFKDDLYEYVFFSETNETTAVEISAINNLKFNDYIGSTLKVETEGSITAGDITLENTDSTDTPGLILHSGMNEEPILPTGYSVEELIFPGDYNSTAYDINNSGQVVGSSTNSAYKTRAFLYANGQITTLDSLPESSYSIAYDLNNSGQILVESKLGNFIYSDGQITELETWSNDLNDSGQVVGETNDGDFWPWEHAFLWNDGQITDLGTLPNAYTSVANDINNSGQVVGYSELYNGSYRAFLYSDGQMVDLGILPGGTDSVANAINDLGQIVGYSSNYKQWDRAFLYSDGQMVDLGVLSGGDYSEALDINNSGQVVGYANNEANGWNWRAFLYSDGQISDLNSLIPAESGWTLELAYAINDRGQIVGQGSFEGRERGFLLDPLDFTATALDGVTVGNISTLGDSIDIQGLKLTLTGEKIATEGGAITLDAPTSIDSDTDTLTFDSTNSSDAEVGGDLTFKKTIDGESAGTQSLVLEAGQGNITFEEAVGSESPLKDLTVNGAKTFVALEDITNDGDITLKVIDDIATSNLFSGQFSKIYISLGKIDDQIYDSSGNVTTGSITAQELEILSNGKYTAQGSIETIDGDVDIIALEDITVSQIKVLNGASSLVSGIGSITATASITSDNGFAALARQNITAEDIQSNKNVVILKSSLGQVTVNGEISSYDDVSVSAVNNIVAQKITSQDGAIALISAGGTVQAQGQISSMEDVTLGAANEVMAQTITSQLGRVGLVSTESTVNANGGIYSAFDVEISANQNITTDTISSEGSTVTLVSNQGSIAIAGDIFSNGGKVYISSTGNLVSKNIISKGGFITAISSQSAITTGYLRSDKENGSGGKIYLKAAGKIRVIEAVDIDGTDYSIYTGIKKKGWVAINYESEIALKQSEKAKKFSIGNASVNGTVAQVSGGLELLQFKPTIKPTTPQQVVPLLIFEMFKIILDAGGNAPGHQTEINPLTNKPYGSPEEYQLVEKMTKAQRFRIRILLDNNRIERNDVFSKGVVDDAHGCFKLELSSHLGDNQQSILHDQYATYVTGSSGDFLVINTTGIFAFYDGLVKSNGAIYQAGLETAASSVAEVKTGSSYGVMLRKYLPTNHPNYLSTPLTQDEKNNYRKLNDQLNRYITVADTCQLNFFLSFSNGAAARAGREIYQNLILNPRPTPKAIKVYGLTMPSNL